jgi:ArgJ family
LAVAKSVAASSLTKAAIFGHDPNWGRIACAAGYSGTPVTVCGYCWYCCIENCKPFEVTFGENTHEGVCTPKNAGSVPVITCDARARLQWLAAHRVQ